jgi:hypothetical protein
MEDLCFEHEIVVSSLSWLLLLEELEICIFRDIAAVLSIKLSMKHSSDLKREISAH